MTATLTKHVANEANPLLRRRIGALDGGNRTIQWLDPSGDVRTIPAYCKELEEWEEVELDGDSVLVELETNERFILGKEAQIQKGKPIYETNKSEMAQKLVYAALEPNPGSEVVVIECLRVALPDSRHKENVAYIKALEGTYSFQRNGEWVHATVRKAEPVDECRAAYRFARKEELFQYPHYVNGVLNLGGGTGQGCLYSASGSPLRGADVLVDGTFALAKKIDAALLSQVGQSQDLGLIMDAIADGSLQVGAMGPDFTRVFPKCRDAWLEEIRGKLRAAWSSYLSEIGEVLIVGGSASLALQIERDTKGRFKVAPNPQEICVRGMVL